MRVARSQTKRAISNAKHAIGLKLGGRLAYQIYIKLDFHKKSHMAGFPKSGHICIIRRAITFDREEYLTQLR